MDAQNVLEVLRDYLRKHGAELGIVTLGIFGSVARNEAAQDSDVDVVVSLAKPNLFTISRIRQDLEQELHHHVDIVSMRKKMNPYLMEMIQREARYV